MESIVYLVRNNDLYNIGYTTDLQRTLKYLRPDETILTVTTNHPKALQARLLKRYKRVRVPGTSYLRLSNQQLLDCISQLNIKSKLNTTFGSEVSIGITGSILLAFFSITLFIILRINLFNTILFSLLVSSTPMFMLLLFGHFGGYETEDLPFISSLLNRLKAFTITLILMLFAYGLYLIKFP